MLALERRNLILEKLQNEKRVVVSELSQLYGVSEETIRRDLDKLEKEGLAIKSYGGAVINEDVSIDLPFNVRKNQNVVGKQKMAEIVASLVHDGEHLLLDASTTAVFVAKALKEKERLTVITNSMEILLELADVSGWNIISTGGMMKEGYLVDICIIYAMISFLAVIVLTKVYMGVYRERKDREKEEGKEEAAHES